MRRIVIVTALVLAAGTAEAGWLRKKSTNPAPGSVPGAAGRQSWAGIPGLGPPIPPSPVPRGLNPVVGSVSRTGLFAHPVTGRTRYRGTAYDPVHGSFRSYHFRK